MRKIAAKGVFFCHSRPSIPQDKLGGNPVPNGSLNRHYFLDSRLRGNDY
jgi:hypothetical protein